MQIGNLCLQSYPCKHHVEIDGREKCMSGVEIYKKCIDMDLDVPEHFLYCKDIYEKDKIIHAISNQEHIKEIINDKTKEYIKNTQNFGSRLLVAAIKHKNVEVIMWLLVENNVLPDYSSFEEVLKTDNFMLFINLLNYDYKEYYEMRTLLSIASHYMNFNAVKYLIETKKVSFCPFPWANPLISFLLSDVEKKQDLQEYLVKKSIENSIVYYGNDVITLKKNNLYDELKSFVKNNNMKISVVIKSDYKYHKQYNKKYKKYLKEIFEIFGTSENYNTEVIFAKGYDIQQIISFQIDVETYDSKKNIKNVCLVDNNDTKFYLSKIINGNTASFIFSPKESFLVHNAVYSNIRFLIEAESSDFKIKEIKVKVNLKWQSTSYPITRKLDNNVNCVFSGGVYTIQYNS